MPISNLSPEIREALARRGMGQNVGPASQVNPPTAPTPATIPTPSASMQGAGMATPQGDAGGAIGAGSLKDINDSKIIDALITYIKRKGYAPQGATL